MPTSETFKQTLKLNLKKKTKIPDLKPAPTRELIAVYDTLKEFMEKQIQCNAYSVVDLTKLFWPNVQESDIDALGRLEEAAAPSVEVEDLMREDDEQAEEVSRLANFT